MQFKRMTPEFSFSPQVSAADVTEAANAGFRMIIANRPDREDPGQPDAAEIEALARNLGMAFAHVPVTAGTMDDAKVSAMRAALARAPGPVLAYCRSGNRAALMWALAQAEILPTAQILQAAATAGVDVSPVKARIMAAAKKQDEQASAQPGGAGRAKMFDIVIVGGGSAGISTAASLLKRKTGISIAVVEPADTHYYQPGWTLVGAGVFTQEVTRHPMAKVMPDAVTWIKQAASGFTPEQNEVILADGSTIGYRVLIAAPGLKLNWAAIAGLEAALGKNGVTSNYRYDLAPYTHQLAQGMKAGRALFSQPPMPIKCAGAPQKAMYLSCDIMKQNGVLKNIEVEFHNAGAVLFGVPAYVPALMKYVEAYGIDLRFGSKLVGVDGPARVARFERAGADGAVETIEREFDMLHVVPPQVAPDFVVNSPLASESGFIAVDQGTLRHVKYENVFSLGDACATSNAKTAAAARKQAPVVAVNALAALEGKPPTVYYDGYGSCPLTVERGKIVLAEFGYGGKLLPSFPAWLLDGTQPTRAAWFLKDRVLPFIYWNGMLKGHEWMAAPNELPKAS